MLLNLVLNLVQKLPFPTELPVLCPWDFIGSILFLEVKLYVDKKLDGKSPGSRYDYFDSHNLAAPLASDHGCLTEPIFLHTFS